MSLLGKIDSPKDLKKLNLQDLKDLASELRSFVIDEVSSKEGHLGASLGVVELTIVIHYLFNTPDDLLVWDVGHQAYIHKILTGRREAFKTNRQIGGISGFPKMSESIYDAFGTGHSSTSISAVLGMALASKLKGENRKHIAVIGDASISSGMAFEGLNHVGVSDADILIVLNDNAMGIDPNVGAFREYLSKIKKDVSLDNFFEILGIKYFGPVDGHDIEKLTEAIRKVKEVQGPKLLHVITTKGKGYKKAEEDQVRFHAPGKFDISTGSSLSKDKNDNVMKYQDVFGDCIVELADKNKSLVAITPAMPTGSSLLKMMKKYPERAIDVGIAEQHALTVAAGYATRGIKVFVTVYSTFLQRAYDQLIHDIAIQNLPVVLCIDRSGIVGEDGPTHHGLLDISQLRAIPNMIVSAPSNEIELNSLMRLAEKTNKPFSIRYPRGYGEIKDYKGEYLDLDLGKGKQIKKGTKLAIVCIGSLLNRVVDAVDELERKEDVGIYNMLFVKPLDDELLRSIFDEYKYILTVEEGQLLGGFGSAILEWSSLNEYSNKIYRIGVEDVFIEHGKVDELHELAGLSKNAIKKRITEILIA